MKALLLLLVSCFISSSWANEKQNKIDLPLPQLKLEKSKLSDALALIAEKSKDADPDGKGINLVIANAENIKEDLSRSITMDLSNIPTREAIRYVLMGTKLSMKVNDDQRTVVIAKVVKEELVTKFYKVSSALPSYVSPNDIKLASNEKKLLDFFESTGVSFPKGAKVTFNAGTSTVSLTNTETNQKKMSDVLLNLGVLR